MIHPNMLSDSDVVLMVRCGGWGVCLRNRVAASSVSVLLEDFLCREGASHPKLSYTIVTAVGFQY